MILFRVYTSVLFVLVFQLLLDILKAFLDLALDHVIGCALQVKRLEELPLFASFAEPPAETFAPSEADTILATLDPDTLTPKEALELVYRLKAGAGPRST